jgi:hypothetical protein
VKFAVAFILSLIASTSAVSSLDAPLPRRAVHQANTGRAPQLLVAFTSGETTLASIALVP